MLIFLLTSCSRVLNTREGRLLIFGFLSDLPDLIKISLFINFQFTEKSNFQKAKKCVQGRRHRGAWGVCPPPPLFCIAKRKNRNKGKSRKDFQAETIKRLSPRLKCYCFGHSRAPRIQKFFLPANHGGRQYFPVFLGPSALKSILPARVWLLHYFNFDKNYDFLKSKSPCILLNKNINFNKNKTESKMGNSTHNFREMSFVLQLI